MKRIYRSTALVAGVGLFFSAALHAQVVQHALTCNGCTQQQVESLLPSCAVGYQYVADFDADRLYLGCYTTNGTRPAMRTDTSLPRQRNYQWPQPPASEQNTFQAYQNVYAANGHALDINARVSVNADLAPSTRLGDDGYINAYDALHSTQNMDTVKIWLMNTDYTPSNTEGFANNGTTSPQLSAVIAQLFNNIKTSVISFNYTVNLTVIFHDGSQMTFAFDNQNGRWEYVPGTARDAHDNLIPDSYTAIGGNNGLTYDYNKTNPGYDLTNFLGTLQLDNVQPQGSPTKVIACVTVDGTVTCHYVTVTP